MVGREVEGPLPALAGSQQRRLCMVWRMDGVAQRGRVREPVWPVACEVRPTGSAQPGTAASRGWICCMHEKGEER